MNWDLILKRLCFILSVAILSTSTIFSTKTTQTNSKNKPAKVTEKNDTGISKNKPANETDKKKTVTGKEEIYSKQNSKTGKQENTRSKASGDKKVTSTKSSEKSIKNKNEYENKKVNVNKNSKNKTKTDNNKKLGVSGKNKSGTKTEKEVSQPSIKSKSNKNNIQQESKVQTSAKSIDNKTNKPGESGASKTVTKSKSDKTQKKVETINLKDSTQKMKEVVKGQNKSIKPATKELPEIDKSGKKKAAQKITSVNKIIKDSTAAIEVTDTDSAQKTEKKVKRGKSKSTFEVVLCDTLSKGVYYRKVKIGNSKEKILIHVVEADLTNPNISLAMFKGKENSSELEKLHDMVKRYNESTGENVLASVNGSFWKAFYNYPMGPTVIDGEVVEMRAYKSWHSAFVDENEKIYIDNFSINGTISIGKKKYNLSMVNRRNDSSGICLYNKYVGDSVPYISKRMVSRAFEDALLDSAFRDITDKEFDTVSFKSTLLKLERDSSIELNMRKIIAQYTDRPIINKDIKCVVIGIADSGLVKVPVNGFVLTIGYNLDSLPLKAGDIFTLKYTTDKHSKSLFKYAVCGTPRLLQSGRSLFEGPQKRNRSRFKWEDLPRTGIGTNKAGDRMFLIAASPTYKSIGVKGCTLENFAFAMKKLKIYDAVNLDGGGSSVMLINNKNVLSCPDCSRRLSIGVGITVKNNLSDK